MGIDNKNGEVVKMILKTTDKVYRKGLSLAKQDGTYPALTGGYISELTWRGRFDIKPWSYAVTVKNSMVENGKYSVRIAIGGQEKDFGYNIGLGAKKYSDYKEFVRRLTAFVDMICGG